MFNSGAMEKFKNFSGKCKTVNSTTYITFLFFILVLLLLAGTNVVIGEDVNLNKSALEYDYEIAKNNYFESLSNYSEAKAMWLISREKYLENKNDEKYENFISSTGDFTMNLSIVLENYNEMLKKRILSENSFDDITKKEQISRINRLLDKIRDIKKRLNESTSQTDSKSQLNVDMLKNFIKELQETYTQSQNMRGMVVTTILKYKTKIVIAGLVEDSLKINENIAQLKASGHNTTEIEEKLCKLNNLLNQSYANYQKCVNLMNLSTSESLAEAENLFKSTYTSLYKTKTGLNDIYNSIPDGWLSELESADSTFVAKGDGKAVINIREGDNESKANVKIYVIGSVTLKGDLSSVQISPKNLKEINSGEGKVYGGEGNIEITGNNLIIEISGKDINIAITGNGNATLTGTGTYKACNKGLCVNKAWEGKNINFSK
ncbi:MAG: hypothetical protein CVT88_08065 [Candidatus Altiarchaeales archaeon HGW-Altiarchaeales-1]|nr:MAG: hypothetical protein CVT88_08065 [Candidatus Altiarchaeales archaeon HGW-Altiarchaeales-1]